MLGNSAYEVNRHNYMKHTPAHKFRVRASLATMVFTYICAVPTLYYIKSKQPNPEEQAKLEQEKNRKDTERMKIRQILYEDRHLYSKETRTKGKLN